MFISPADVCRFHHCLDIPGIRAISDAPDTAESTIRLRAGTSPGLLYQIH